MCEPAQSKCKLTFHKSHFIRKFTGKMPRPRLSPERRHIDIHFARACAAEMQVNISQEPIYREIYREKARAQSGHPDQAPAFILTVRTLDCGHAVWGKNAQTNCQTNFAPRENASSKKEAEDKVDTQGPSTTIMMAATARSPSHRQLHPLYTGLSGTM